MKRSYRSVESSKPGVLITVIFLVCSLVLLSLSDTTSLSKPRQMGITMASFFQNGMHESGKFIRQTFTSFAELKRLSEAYQDTLSQIESYKGIERELEQLESENQRLNDLLGFSESIAFENIPVEVIARDPVNLFSSILINKGSRKGIQNDMAVVAYQDGMIGLVGRVVEVGLNSALVMPLSDKTSYVAARIQENRYQGLIQGNGINSNTLKMEYVSRKALPAIEKEDLVLTSGLNSIYPPDIIIGRIVSIESREYASSLDLELQPVVDFDRLEYLLVLKEKERD